MGGRKSGHVCGLLDVLIEEASSVGVVAILDFIGCYFILKLPVKNQTEISSLGEKVEYSLHISWRERVIYV